jgi:GNAT superfamily N-acetyltransferase
MIENLACGEEALDKYLRTQARQDQERNVSVTHVLVREATKQIVGFCTIANADVPLAEIPREVARKITKHSRLPALLIARLAGHKDAHGQGFGVGLLMYALGITMQQSLDSGVALVIVDAKHEKARSFYTKCGFAPLYVPQVRSVSRGLMAAIGLGKLTNASYPLRLFMTMATVQQIASRVS